MGSARSGSCIYASRRSDIPPSVGTAGRRVSPIARCPWKTLPGCEHAHRFCDERGLAFDAYSISRGGGSPGRGTALPPLQRPLRLGAARHHVRALPTTGVPLAIREDWPEVLKAAPDTGTINENLLLRASVLTPHRLLPPYTSSPTFRSAPEEFGHRVDKRARASDQRDLDPRGGSLPRPARRLRCDLVVAQTEQATQAADSRRRKRPEDASPSNRYRRWMDCDRFPAFGPSVTIGRACGTCARGRARNATHQVHLVSPAQPTIRCPRASRSRTAGCPWSR